MSLSLLSQALLAAESNDQFQAPSVEHSFFFDKIGDGSVIASVKAKVSAEDSPLKYTAMQNAAIW